MFHSFFETKGLNLRKFASCLIMISVSLVASACVPRNLDTIIPTFSTDRLVELEDRILTLEEANNYRFNDTNISLEAFDNRDGDITSRINAEPLGLELWDVGYYYFIRFSVEDRSGNYNYIDIPFIVLQPIDINGSNFYDYFDFSYEYDLHDWNQSNEYFTVVSMEQSLTLSKDQYCIYLVTSDLETEIVITSELRHTNGSNLSREDVFSSYINVSDELFHTNKVYIDSSMINLLDTFSDYDASIITTVYGTASIVMFYTETPVC